MAGERDYSQWTPLEFNRELICLCESIPQTVDIPEDWFNNDPGIEEVGMLVLSKAPTRNRSEHREALERILGNLLNSAPITPHFRRHILDAFRLQYIVGLRGDFKSNADSSLIPILDLDFPNSGGIFDPQRACEIERKAYHDELALVDEGANYSHNSEDTEEIAGAYEFQENWRQEFIKKYGDEP